MSELVVNAFDSLSRWLSYSFGSRYFLDNDFDLIGQIPEIVRVFDHTDHDPHHLIHETHDVLTTHEFFVAFLDLLESFDLSSNFLRELLNLITVEKHIVGRGHVVDDGFESPTE